MNIAFHIIFAIIIVLIAFILFAYGRIINILVKGRKLERIKALPNISVIIPAYNEEKYIERKIENILECYPKSKMEIFVVDSGSTDNTMNVAKKMPVKLLYSQRGKVNALNKGMENASNNIIVMTDADTLLDKDAVQNAISCLHGKIAAVGGRTILNKKSLFYMKSKLAYSDKDWELRYKEGLLDTTVSLDGKLIAFRKDLFHRFPSKTYQDDYELTFSLRKLGYRSVIDNDARVYEEVPASFMEEIKQIRNRMRISIIMNFRKINFLFNPRYSYFGMLIFPFRRFFPLIFPILMLYVIVYIAFYSWILAVLIILTAVTSAFIANKEYMLMQLLGVSLAWLDILTLRVKSGAYWKKVKS